MTLGKQVATLRDERYLTFEFRSSDGVADPSEPVVSFRGWPTRDEAGEPVGVPLRVFGPHGDELEDHPEADELVTVRRRSDLLAAALRTFECRDGEWDTVRIAHVFKTGEDKVEVTLNLVSSKPQITYQDVFEFMVQAAFYQAFGPDATPVPDTRAPGGSEARPA